MTFPGNCIATETYIYRSQQEHAYIGFLSFGMEVRTKKYIPERQGTLVGGKIFFCTDRS